MRERLRDNPVRAAGGIGGVILSLLVALADWGIESLPDGVPDEVTASAYGLVVLAAGVVAERAGKWLQRRFTEPKDVIDNIVRRMEGEPLKGSAYVKARAANDTDPHGPALDAESGDG